MTIRRGMLAGNVITTLGVAIALGCADASAPPLTDETTPAVLPAAVPGVEFNPDIVLLGQTISRALQQDEIGPWWRRTSWW